MNYREPFAWLIIVGLIFFILWQRSQSKIQQLERSQDNQLHQQRIENLTQQAKTAAARADSLRASFNNRHTKDSIDLRALSVRNRAMSENVQKLRLPVQTIIDTLQPLREFVMSYDSLLAGKDTLIHEMTLRHSAQVVELDKIIDLQAQQIMAEQLKTKLWEEVAVKTEKDYNKERRRKGLWRTTAAILAGGVLFLTLQP